MDNLTLGQQLKQAREALNLSIQDVASQTQLKTAHIDALENDIFILPNVAPAFVRGYVRSYVRFLRLPEELIGSVNYGEVSLPSVQKKPAITTNNRSQGKFLKGLTILVLLVAFGMTLLWWWQEHQKDQQNRDALVSTPAMTAAQPQSESNSVALNTQSSAAPTALPQTESVNNAIAVVQTNPEVAPVVEPAPQPEPQVTEPAQLVQTESSAQPAQTTVEVAPVAQEPAQAVQNTQEIANQPATNEVAAPQPTDAVSVLTQTATTDNAEQTATAEQPVAMGNEELRIEITGASSWITVRGAKGKRLAEKLYNAGEVLSFNDNEQYRLTIGAPANVKIYYKGQQVPLKVDGRVARIRLPLAN